MKELIRKSKQNSLYGGRIRRMFKVKGIAAGILLVFFALFVTALCLSGDIMIQSVGAFIVAVPTLIMAAPALLAVPKFEGIGLSSEEEKGMATLAEYFKKMIDDYGKELITAEDMNGAMKDKFEQFTKKYELDIEKFGDVLKAQGLEIKAIKDTQKVVGKTLHDALKESLTPENIKNLVQDKRGQIQIELKAAATIMTPNASTNAPHALSFEIVPGIQEAPVEPPVVLAALNKGRTNSRTLIWINRVNGDGGAAFIAEGALKPLKDWEYNEESSTAKKVAVSAKVSSEMLNDFEYMEGEIRMLLYRDLFDVVDNRLLNGTAAPDPIGIINVAGGYVGTGLDGMIRMPNNADAIRAGMLQMRLLNFSPDIVFMNPTDSALNFLEKSSDGHYIRQELNGVIAGVRVIETTAIDPDKFLLMDSKRWIVKILEAYRLEFGWENDDFTRNLVTVIAEMRLHSYINSIDEGSVLYDEFSVVKTAIEAP